VRAAALVQGVFVCINCRVTPRTFLRILHVDTSPHPAPRILHDTYILTTYRPWLAIRDRNTDDTSSFRHTALVRFVAIYIRASRLQENLLYYVILLLFYTTNMLDLFTDNNFTHQTILLHVYIFSAEIYPYAHK